MSHTYAVIIHTLIENQIKSILLQTKVHIILYKKFVEHHVIKLILLKISKLLAHLTQAIIRDKLQR